MSADGVISFDTIECNFQFFVAHYILFKSIYDYVADPLELLKPGLVKTILILKIRCHIHSFQPFENYSILYESMRYKIKVFMLLTAAKAFQFDDTSLAVFGNLGCITFVLCFICLLCFCGNLSCFVFCLEA